MMESDARFLSLAQSGQRAAEVADDGIDWDETVLKPRWMTARIYGSAISQLYYGERATIEMCKRLMDDIETPAVRGFIETQIADEERHLDYYERYLARLGEFGDIEEGVAMAYDGALAWRGSHHGAIVAFHVILEGEGLAIQQLYSDWFRCPLYRQVNALIARDEGRHVAFGRTYLKATLGALPLEERIEIFRWIRALWFHCADAIHAETPRVVSMLVGRDWSDRRWKRQEDTLAKIGLIAPGEEALFARV